MIKFGSNLKLIVTVGFSSTKRRFLRDKSLHYGGRAFDFAMNRSKKTGPDTTWRKSDAYKKILVELASIAYRQAMFDFVEIKRNHIHVSCRK